MIKQFQIDSIEAKRFVKANQMPKQVRIDNNSSVININKVDENEVEVSFRFSANYTSIGIISMEGTILFDGNVDEIMSLWRDKRKMPDDMGNQVQSAILNNCLIEAWLIARELKMPPPIPPPIKMAQSSKKKDKNFGVEIV